jgi:c(7)-type cytochrome triheme protein
MTLAKNKLVRSRSRARKVFCTKTFTVILTFVFVGFYLAACGGNDGEQPAANIHDESIVTESEEVRFDFPADLEYSKFGHENEQHARLPCLVCHTREDNSAQMKFPGHIPCASCHTEHFADNKHQICSICHTEPEAGTMKAFPALRTFNAKFDHAKHLPQANCADCHRPARAGATFSVPTRSNSHATCFQCHKPEAKFDGRDIASCSTCHEPGRPGRPTGGIRALRANFNHAAHAGRENLNCNSCHTIRAGAERGRQVSAPAAVMHLATSRGNSCATCHNGKRAFGGEDFASCKRCHKGDSFNF